MTKTDDRPARGRRGATRSDAGGGGGGGEGPDREPVKERCRWCGRAFVVATGRGRPRLYCRQGCRQQAHMARKLASTHGLGDDDLVISRTALDELQSRLYCLQAAIEDVDRDLALAADADDIAEALRWLLENARPVAELWIEPRVAADV